MRIPIKINNRIIGILSPDIKLFKKSVFFSKHLFRVTDSWGIDAKFFTESLLPDNFTIAIYDKEDGITYLTNARIFKEKGEYKHFKPYGSQIMLRREYFSKLYK